MLRWTAFLVLLVGPLMLAGAERASDGIARGREVYVAEGCINCHSQYVRPGTGDVARWGPSRPLAEALEQTPPLLGNRRQGPDLQNVANRRPRAWQRVHLADPRAITPGSRMPSYSYLFAGDAARGEALLDYLDSLGNETMAARWADAQQWSPRRDTAVAADDSAGRRSYLAACAGCHGPKGRGDGQLAAQLPVPPRDLVSGAWIYQGPDRKDAAEPLALARLIKFGVPGSAMAGHEYLEDGEILALAAYVRALRQGETVPAPAAATAVAAVLPP